MIAAVKVLTTYAFETLGLIRIDAPIRAGNTASVILGYNARERP